VVHTETTILIAAEPASIYPLAAAVERWPELLPHYRWVRILRAEGPCRLVEMAARRDRIPVRWWAEQRLDPETPRIRFKHVRGATAGMEVEWTFESAADGTLVRVAHDLHPRSPVSRFVAEHIIGPYFIENIAGKTLRCIKQLAESGGC